MRKATHTVLLPSKGGDEIRELIDKSVVVGGIVRNKG